jgi:disulfide bond formation protein DsbB
VDTDAVTLLFAFLAVAAELAVLGAVALAVGGRWSTTVAAWRLRVTRWVGPDALGLACVVAAVCTAGSLYLSEVANFRPCFLCWVQRGFMYPLVLLFGLAAWRRAYRVGLVLAGVAVLGGAVSVYHMLVERFPGLESTACDPTTPCSLIWVERFGYLTIPTMALSGFALIAALALIAHRDATGGRAGEG